MRSFIQKIQSTAIALVCLSSFFLSSLVAADQKDPSLPRLFDELLNAPSSEAANELESRIWNLWLEIDDPEADKLLREVVRAMSAGDLEEALRLNTILVELAPSFAEGWNKRATVYYLMGNYNASVEDIQKTINLEPRHFGAISGLGLIFLRQGNQSAALEAFQQVLEVSPQSVSAQRSVGELRKQLGEEI